MSELRDRREASEFPIPDLELPPPRRSQSGMRPIHLVQPAARRDHSPSASASDLDLDAGAGPPLELELDALISDAAAPNAYASRASALNVEPDGAGLDSGVVEALEVDAAWPSGVTPRPGDLLLDAGRIRDLAGFGAAPGSITLMAVYAVRVWFRTRALRRASRAVERELLAAEAGRDQLLAELAESARPALERHAALSALFEPLSSIDSAVQRLTTDLSAQSAQQAVALEELERRRADIVMRFEGASHAEAEHAQVHAQLEQGFDRALARQKRCFIEIRALEQNSVSAEDAAAPRIATLRAHARTLGVELETASRAFEASRAAHDEHVRAVRQTERALGEADRQLTQAAALARDARERGAAGLHAVAARRRDVWANIGRAALRLQDATAFDGQSRRALAQRDARVLELARRAEEHRRAMQSADARKVRAGVAVVGLAVLLSLGVVLMLSIP